MTGARGYAKPRWFWPTTEVLSELNGQVMALLSDGDNFVRHRAIECFGCFHAGERLAAPWLHGFLKDPDVLTRVETLETLEEICDSSALPAMLESLRDDEALVRSYAAICLAQLGGENFRAAIEQAAEVEKVETAKPWFARSLLLLGDEDQFPKLLQLLSSNSPTARCSAANALTAFEWSPAQLQLVLAAVAHASHHVLARSDESTMKKVLKEILEDFSGALH